MCSFLTNVSLADVKLSIVAFAVAPFLLVLLPISYYGKCMPPPAAVYWCIWVASSMPSPHGQD